MTNYFKKYLFKLTFVFVVAICGVLGIGTSAYADDLENWTKQPDLLKPVAFSSSVVLDGKVYVIGGVEWPNNANFILSSSVYAYDPSTGDCVKKADIPEPLQLHKSLVVNGKIYVFGGKGDNNSTSTASVYEYDPSLNKWSKKADMPQKIIRDFSLVVIDNDVYLIGGVSSQNILIHEIYIYNPVSNTWTKKVDMPSTLSSKTSVGVNGKIYIVGENNSANGICYSSVTIYDPITNTFRKKYNGLPNFNPTNGAIAFHDKIYFFGRIQDRGIQEDRYITIYDTNTDTFVEKSKIPATISQNNFNSFILNDKIHILGGSMSGRYSNSVYSYEDPDSQSDAKLTLEDGPIILEVGQTYKATATITPKSAANQKIIWSISDPSVATIDQNGVLTGVSEGYTLIKVTSEDGKLSDMCKVQVKASGELPISKNRALLRVALTNGSINEYDLSMPEVQNFINWYNGRAEGKGKISFAINKNANVKPFKTRTDYLVFDKIYSFEVNEYELNNNER